MQSALSIFERVQQVLAGCQEACAAAIAGDDSKDRHALAAAQAQVDASVTAVHNLATSRSPVPAPHSALAVCLSDGGMLALQWQAHPRARRYLVEVNGELFHETTQPQLVYMWPSHREPVATVVVRALDLYGLELGRLTAVNPTAAGSGNAQTPRRPDAETKTGHGGVNPWRPGGQRL